MPKLDLTTGDTRLLIDTCAAYGLLRTQAAYVLATAYHETAATMKPIMERGGRSYFNKYNAGTRIGKVLGNTQEGDGYRYRGRGYAQTTGRRNYGVASMKLGVDCVGKPEYLLQSKYAAKAIVIAMIEGWYTGHKFSRHITASKTDYVNARRIINGRDKAALIAGYAHKYERLLANDGYTNAPVTPAAKRAAPKAAPAAPKASKATLWGWLKGKS